MNKYKLYILIVILAISFVDSKAQFDFFESKATIGGYGEMHYNYKNDNGVTKNTLDFHRFVVFVGYSFSEKWSFKSEIEIEHNYVSDGEGELSLEQAYLDYRFRDYLGFQAGVILVSAGLINENHEPTLFLGVERPNYAKYIIPTTWFGNGASIYGKLSGFEYKLNFMEGLIGDKFSLNNAIRNGRQKGFESDASAMLYNLKIDYTDILGLKIGGSAIYNNSISDSLSIPFTLLEFHADYRQNGLILVGEYGNINYSNNQLMNSNGYYFDFGYDFSKLLNVDWKIIPFGRYSRYNTASETENGGDEEKMFDFSEWMFGISVLPIDNVVLKADYSQIKNGLSSTKTEFINLGIGYRF
jgi:hypothetical protein